MTFVELVYFFFFFQAEDGIRDIGVTGVQTCALPISREQQRDRQPRGAECHGSDRPKPGSSRRDERRVEDDPEEIGRASCRGKSVDLGGRRRMKKKKKKDSGNEVG